MFYLYISADGDNVGQSVPAEFASERLEHAASDAAADVGEMEEALSGDEEETHQQQYHELGDTIEEEREDDEEIGYAEEIAEVSGV